MADRMLIQRLKDRQGFNNTTFVDRTVIIIGAYSDSNCRFSNVIVSWIILYR